MAAPHDSLVKGLLGLVAGSLLRIGLESLGTASSAGIVREVRGLCVVGKVVAGLRLARNVGRKVVKSVLSLAAEPLLAVWGELVLDYW